MRNNHRAALIASSMAVAIGLTLTFTAPSASVPQQQETSFQPTTTPTPPANPTAYVVFQARTQQLAQEWVGVDYLNAVYVGAQQAASRPSVATVQQTQQNVSGSGNSGGWAAVAMCEEGGNNDPNYGYYGIKEWNGFDGYPTAGSAPQSVQLQWEAVNIGAPPDESGGCHSY